MPDEQEKPYTRLELADRLEQLARQLRSGRLELAGYSGQAPETADLRFKVKGKHGDIRCKLEVRWSSPGADIVAAESALRSWQDAFKPVKKRLAQSFKALKRSAQGPLTAADPALEEFLAASRAFAAIAAAEWPEAMQEYQTHLDNLTRAVASQEQASILHELEDLERNMITCHGDLR